MARSMGNTKLVTSNTAVAAPTSHVMYRARDLVKPLPRAFGWARTLDPNVPVPHGPQVLEALESCPSGECGGCDRHQRDGEPHDPVLHRLEALECPFGCHARPP